MQLYEVITQYIERALSAVRFPFRGEAGYVDHRSTLQKVQCKGLSGEQLQDVEVIQQFGFSSGIPAQTQLIIVPLDGDTRQSVVIGTENTTFRVEVEAGETVVYNQWGAKIVFKKEQEINIVCESLKIEASKEVLFATPKVTIGGEGNDSTSIRIKGSTDQEGTIQSSGDQIAAGISQMQHVHGGVNPGGGLTSIPM